jgi:CBS domain-containing protein
MGIPEYEAKRYEGRLRRGGILMSVHCDDSQWAKLAEEILENTGAEDISRTSERRADYATGDRPAPRSPAADGKPGRARPKPLAPRPRTNQIAISRDHPLARVGNLSVADVMTPNVQTVNVNALLSEASAQMRNLDVGFLCVRSGDEIVGILTDRDITVRATAEGHDPSAATVRDAMTDDYVCCHEDQQVIEAAGLMEEHGVRRLPVLNRDNRLVGVLSVDDIAARSGDDTLAGKILSGGMIARKAAESEHRIRRT